VKVIRRTEQSHLSRQSPTASCNLYVFYEKNTGSAHFHVEAGPDGHFPIDQAAGLLAMHCMVRGQSPSDYVVMVQADSHLVSGVNDRAEKLLQAGHSAKSSVKLTRREEEVLDGILRSLSNKEIGSGLNLSERTVKFHVSSLLAKFKVRGRMELVRQTGRNISSPLPMPVPAPTREIHSYSADQNGYRRPMGGRAPVLPLAKPQWMA
jgi:DNA-binding CsgD family transcriptional regulator